jgi:FkbM family methyltransferase
VCSFCFSAVKGCANINTCFDGGEVAVSVPNEPMISCSASFEDVILQRALKHVQYGCYVDVGASNPIIDSNTAAFYKKGWRGICIEPLTPLNPMWVEERPEDLLINAIAGAEPGEATLYFYISTSQISTASVATMEHWKKHNILPNQELVVPVVTLNQVMEQFLADRTIHLLSIDVEGSEKSVLAGFDLKKYCPWIIVIEAALPGTQKPSHAAWEPVVIEAGYTMVYEDGFNRFYLSDKKPELREFFMNPPNVWDAIIPIKQYEAEKKVEALEKTNEAMKAEIEGLKNLLSEKVTLPENFWDYVPCPDDTTSIDKMAQLEKDNETLKRHLKAAQQELALSNFLKK